MENVRIAVLDSHDSTVCFLDNGAKRGLKYFDDELHVYLQGAACTFHFTASSRHKNSKYLVVGNKLAFHYNNKNYYFNIMSEKRDEKEVKIGAYSSNLELLNETTGPYRAPRAMSFDEYITAFGFARGVIRLGLNEVSNLRITHEWEGTATILNRLFSLANVFSAEIEFVPILSNTYSLERIVLNVYRRNDGDDNGLGQYRPGVVLRYGSEIEGITKKSDITELYTAIRPRGRDGLTIASVNQTVRDEAGRVEFFTSPGALEILAPLARDRFPSNVMEGVSDRYIAMEWEYDTPNVNMLFGQALDRLRKHSVPKVSYEVKGHFGTDVGDTIRIVDEEYNPALFLRARVIEQIRSFTKPSRDRTIFDNFTVLQSEIAPDLLARMQQLFEANRIFAGSIITDNGILFRNREGETTLTAVVMDRGTNITDQFEIRWIRDGLQIATGASVTVQAGEVPDRAVYRFEALNNEGVVRAMAEATLSNIEDGAPAIIVNAGPEAIVFPATSSGLIQTETTFTVFFNAFLGGNRLASTAEVGTLPSGMSLVSNTDATTTADGSIVLVVEQGATLGGAAIGLGFISVAYTVGEAVFTRALSWSKAFAGSSGDPGPPGVSLDNVESFFLVSQLSSGVTISTPGWSQEIPTMTPTNRFLWRYDRQYWSDDRVVNTTPIIIGTFAIDGADGVGIESTTVAYQGSPSGVTAPVGQWDINIPIIPEGHFLWTRVIMTFTDGTTTTAFSVSRVGESGEDGVGIVSTIIAYQSWSSGVSTPTGAWRHDIPDVPQGHYLWTRTTLTFSNNTTTHAFSVSRISADGRDGLRGESGIIISAEEPEEPETNQLWQRFPGDPIRRWNGDEWVIHFLSAENLEVDSLSAISANMGTITAGIITNTDQTVIFNVSTGSLSTSHYTMEPEGSYFTKITTHSTLHNGTITTETIRDHYADPTSHIQTNRQWRTIFTGAEIRTYMMANDHGDTEYRQTGRISFNNMEEAMFVNSAVFADRGFISQNRGVSRIGTLRTIRNPNTSTTALMLDPPTPPVATHILGVFSAPVPTGRFGCGALGTGLEFYFGTNANITANTDTVQRILTLRTNGEVEVHGELRISGTAPRIQGTGRLGIMNGGSARGIMMGSSLVSNAWADESLIPTNGLFVRGQIHCAARIIGLREAPVSVTIAAGWENGGNIPGHFNGGIRYQRCGNKVDLIVTNVRSNGVAKPVNTYNLLATALPAAFRPQEAVSTSVVMGGLHFGRVVLSPDGMLRITLDTNMGTARVGIFTTMTYAVAT